MTWQLALLIQTLNKTKKEWIRNRTLYSTASCSIYAEQVDSVGWHRDNEKEFGTNPVIASVSFGETRPFHLKHKSDSLWIKKDIEKVIIPLTHGSLLIMKGKTQYY